MRESCNIGIEIVGASPTMTNFIKIYTKFESEILNLRKFTDYFFYSAGILCQKHERHHNEHDGRKSGQAYIDFLCSAAYRQHFSAVL